MNAGDRVEYQTAEGQTVRGQIHLVIGHNLFVLRDGQKRGLERVVKSQATVVDAPLNNALGAFSWDDVRLNQDVRD